MCTVERRSTGVEGSALLCLRQQERSKEKTRIHLVWKAQQIVKSGQRRGHWGQREPRGKRWGDGRRCGWWWWGVGVAEVGSGECVKTGWVAAGCEGWFPETSEQGALQWRPCSGCQTALYRGQPVGGLQPEPAGSVEVAKGGCLRHSHSLDMGQGGRLHLPSIQPGAGHLSRPDN